MHTARTRIAASLLALLCTSAAQAADVVTKSVDLGALGVPSSLFYGNTFTMPNGAGLTATDSFYDNYGFVIDDANYNSFTATLDLGNLLGISNLQARLFSGSYLSAPTGSVPGGALQPWTVATGTGTMNIIGTLPLAAGNYVLQVRGNVTGLAGGSYAGVINLSPVPEPKTYAMLGAGLLAMGLMVRRRSRSED